MMQNLKNWLVSSKSTRRFWRIWPEHWKIPKICALMCCFWRKYIMFELKKVQRSYVWWHWRLTQSLKENGLLLSKMTGRIRQIFVHRLENNNFILESKVAELNQKISKTTISTRCSVKTLFYLGSKWIAQLTKLFAHVLQNYCP